MPEIDVPGPHDELVRRAPGVGRGARSALRRRTGSVVHRACLDPTRDEVYDALGRLFDDVARIFPDRFVHIGGDEVNPKWWQESAAVQRFMRERGIADVDALQNLFNERLADLLIDRGRTLVGWDEIAHGDLPRTSIVQSWRGGASRDRAVAQGFDCVFSAGYYLDFFYPADLHYAYDPESPRRSLLRLDERVRADPRLAHVRDGLGWARDFAGRSAVDASPSGTPPGRVLGGEACMWAETRHRRDCSRGASGAACRRSPNDCGRRARCATKRTCICGLSQLRPLLAAFADVDIEARQARVVRAHRRRRGGTRSVAGSVRCDRTDQVVFAPARRGRAERARRGFDRAVSSGRTR